MARYVHQTNAKPQSKYQQWAFLLLKNANLSADTHNSIALQLTTMASIGKTSSRPATIEILINTIYQLIGKLQHDGTTADYNKLPEAHEIMAEVKNMAQRCGTSITSNYIFRCDQRIENFTIQLEKCRTYIFSSLRPPFRTGLKQQKRT